jgi:hypothetical protein
MRTLSTIETEQAAGGLSVLGITEIGFGLRLMGQVGAVAGLAYTFYDFGYGTGTWLYEGYENLMGDSFGGDIYDFLNC